MTTEEVSTVLVSLLFAMIPVAMVFVAIFAINSCQQTEIIKVCLQNAPEAKKFECLNK